MNKSSQVRSEPDSITAVLQSIDRSLTQATPVRETLPGGTHVHVDRPLPFICIHEPAEEPRQAAYEVTSSNASYVIARNRAEAVSVINLVGQAMQKRFGAFLLVQLDEFEQDRLLTSDSPHLPMFEIHIQASEHEAAQLAMNAMAEAIDNVTVRYRRPVLSLNGDMEPQKGLLALLDPRFQQISLKFAPIYRQAKSQSVFPELRERLVANLFDSVLQGIAAFARKKDALVLPTHRALGRSAFVNAVKKLDTQMDKICRSFDFLLALTPVNSAAAWKAYQSGKYTSPPVFHYRPLDMEIDKLKRSLYSLSFDHLEDPVLYEIYREKQQELDLQLTALNLRDTARFKDASKLLYGSVEPELLQSANDIFAALGSRSKTAVERGEDDYADCHQLLHRATCMVSDYQDTCPNFKPEIVIRDDLPAGMMVSGHCLMISRFSRVAQNRVEALLNHEIGVHLITYFTGDTQGLKIFGSGLAGYEGTQEGLAVFAEYLVGGLTEARMRLLAGRVVGCAAMLDGADFTETFRLLVQDYGFAEDTAFNLNVRLFRSGGFAKDAIYLRGLYGILNLLAQGNSLDPFWLGKFAEAHYSLINELTARGLIQKPPLSPDFLTVDGAKDRLTAAQQGLNPADLIS